MDQSADSLPSIDDLRLSPIHRHKLINMARSCRPSYPFLLITNNEDMSLSDDPGTAFAASTKKPGACSTLRFHMDNSVWDVIHKEVMDWRDSSWTSMNLPGKRMCENNSQSYALAAIEAMLILVVSHHAMSSLLGRPGTDRIG